MPTILKCKMCGGDIEVSQDMTVGKCLFCGSTMTLPKIDSDKKARLFNRANEYRINNEFDKAYDAYKTITEEDELEAEAYWGMILSEYGVEYVEDPGTGKRIPTCHRTQITNIQNTTNYKLAVKYADSERKFMYQDEAEELDRLQRDILSVSSKEEAYDVFICYKESDENGERTQDSVLAQEIYGELQRNGIRAFFSRISLEDHLGENYEPYIYAALSSAKVMILVSTKSGYCESTWVRNEWARFIGFMENDPSKTIIPVYKNMSPYEFPPELSKYQAQNMEKVGAIQDLIHGISRMVSREKEMDVSATVKQLVFDSRTKEEEQRRKKKLVKRILIGVGCALVLFALIFGGVKIISSEIKQSRIIEVESGWPDSKKYDEFSVDITTENIEEYLEKVETQNGTYYFPKGAEQGWFGWPSLDFKASGGVSGGTGSKYLPTGVTAVSGKIVFYSFNSLKEWNIESANTFSAHFKTGSFSSIIADTNVISYYTDKLKMYAPEKEGK